MENLGEYLQQKREEQDISIEALVSLTRIPVRFIEAIEANQLDLLPNQVTAKGFLRSYAECVGVDHALITEAFSEFQTPSAVFADARSRNEILSHVQVEKSHRLPFPRRIILTIVGLVFVLLILVGLLSKKDKKAQVLSSVFSPQIAMPDRPDLSATETIVSELPLPETNGADSVLLSGEDPAVPLASEMVLSEEDPQIEMQAARIKETEKLPIVKSPTPKPTPETSGASSETRINEVLAPIVDFQNQEDGLAADVETKEYILSLEAIEASWVQVTIDGDEVREALLQPEEHVQWKANKKFRLTLGNAGGVRVKLDGRELGPFGPSGEVVHKDILVKSVSGQTEISE